MSRKSKIALACVLMLGAAGLSGAVAQEAQPNVRMARELVAAASAFETYTRTAGAIEPGFAGPRDIAGAVNVGASHDPQQLEAGMIAYAAMAALQDRAFVEGVQRVVADDRARDNMVQRLNYNPETAMELPGAESAAARARGALLRQIEPLIADGRRVKQAAYDIQRKPWSKAFVLDGRERLATIKQLAVRPFSPSDEDATRLFRAVSVRTEGRAAASPSPVVMRGLAVAALAIADQAGDDDSDALRPLLTEARSASCVRLAKLNLFQCMAVAGPHYEDVFCLGEHAMIEPGQCMASAAGADAAPRSVQTAQAGSLLIPIAGATPGER
jgi:hypothetical protein